MGRRMRRITKVLAYIRKKYSIFLLIVIGRVRFNRHKVLIISRKK